jgi:hypothetical protein
MDSFEADLNIGTVYAKEDDQSGMQISGIISLPIFNRQLLSRLRDPLDGARINS